MEKISRRYEHSVEDVVGQMLEKRIITSQQFIQVLSLNYYR